ncbi:hypothetical protein [Merismopedia glauca]|uniref:Uncharacterized protein n=2 Tax=Merismopedia TaxID=53402 RepID=A0A2T1C2D5_9CYAN|nr:hypothetical protein C7B64_13145 [Merismopedia glauca CCAP 1448/3]
MNTTRKIAITSFILLTTVIGNVGIAQAGCTTTKSGGGTVITCTGGGATCTCIYPKGQAPSCSC